MANIKRIAVVTCGGDAPGMNAAIRAVTRTALSLGLEVYGIREGYRGLYQNMLEPFNASSVADVIQRGGTFLGTARLKEFATDANIRNTCYANMRALNIDALVVCGGDGSYRGARLINLESGIPTVGIPCTIDNDIAYTDFSIGFDTAVNTCINCLNNLRDTMASHERISVVEVMGRNCGDVAVHAGIAAGAEAILIPEITKTADQWLEYIMGKLKQSRKRNKMYGIVVMAEGVNQQPGMEFFTPDYISQWLNRTNREYLLDSEARGSVLGHLQRGGSPSASDRILASRLGERAVKILLEGASSRCVGIKDNKIIDEDITVALDAVREANVELIELANILAM